MIVASWQRCVAQHRLSREANRPILRLQASEVLPRRQSFIERLSGNLSEIQWLSNLSRRAGHFAVIADDECVLVMQDLGQAANADFTKAGIIDGSCWNEQIAATNGVSMALRHGRTMTVTGSEHYFALLSQFMCTASPIFDHEDKVIGAINVSALDRGDIRDRSFAEHMLRIATRRIQARLFHEHYSDLLRVAVSPADDMMGENWNALVAVDSDGVIKGATHAAASFLGSEGALPLIGLEVEELFDASLERLISSTGEGAITATRNGLLSVSASLPRPRHLTHYVRPAAPVEACHPKRLRLSDFSGKDVACAAMVAKLKHVFNRGLPVQIRGETGTGKQSFAEALHFDATMGRSPLILVDATEFGDHGLAGRLAHTLEHVRAISESGSDLPPPTLVLRDVAVMPQSAQYQIARFLSEIEPSSLASDRVRLRLLCVSQDGQQVIPLEQLRYHLAGETALLAPLRQRSDVKFLIEQMRDRVDELRRPIVPNAMEALLGYAWPGNYRELKHAMQRAALLASNDCISLHDLPDHLFAKLREPTMPAASISNSEVELLRDALASANWNLSEAARRCGISRATMHRKIKAYGLVRPRTGRLSLIETIKSGGQGEITGS